MNITEVAKRSRLPASTIRYYEEKGLIHSIGREGLKRVFSPNVLDTLSLIALGRNTGFSLDEIGEMLLNQNPEKADKHGPEIDREKLLAKAQELDHKIQEITAMRDGLLHAAECPAPTHMECPTFRRYLNIAKRWARPASQ